MWPNSDAPAHIKFYQKHGNHKYVTLDETTTTNFMYLQFSETVVYNSAVTTKVKFGLSGETGTDVAHAKVTYGDGNAVDLSSAAIAKMDVWGMVFVDLTGTFTGNVLKTANKYQLTIPANYFKGTETTPKLWPEAETKLLFDALDQTPAAADTTTKPVLKKVYPANGAVLDPKEWDGVITLYFDRAVQITAGAEKIVFADAERTSLTAPATAKPSLLLDNQAANWKIPAIVSAGTNNNQKKYEPYKVLGASQATLYDASSPTCRYYHSDLTTCTYKAKINVYDGWTTQRFLPGQTAYLYMEPAYFKDKVLSTNFDGIKSGGTTLGYTFNQKDLVAPHALPVGKGFSGEKIVLREVLEIFFSESILIVGTGSAITITPAGAGAQSCATTASWTCAPKSNKLTITPLADLALNKAYTIVVATAGITDLAGNALAAAVTYTFTTYTTVKHKVT